MKKKNKGNDGTAYMGFREKIPFDMNEFDPAHEYFALKCDADQTSYSVYAIGASKYVSVYKKGFLKEQDAKDFLCALPERLHYFKMHPPVLVSFKDLENIANHSFFAKQKSLDDKLRDAKDSSTWCSKHRQADTFMERN